MDSYMNNDEDPINKFLNDIEKDMAGYLTMRLSLLIAEEKLENLIRDDLAEVLTDTNGNFTYRITQKGRDMFVNAYGYSPSADDITFLQFAQINSNPNA
jgi:hypothetical protein